MVIFGRIWRLNRQYATAQQEYEDELRAVKTSADRQRIESQMQFDLEMINDVIRVELTKKLLKEARNLDIPVPSEGHSWERSPTAGDGYLIDSVRDDLKQRIRKERKERRELHFGLWKDILLLVSGLVAVVHLIWTFPKK